MSSDTKAALLESAERVVRNRGFDAFSFADLASDVGIRKASIHYHFPTKAKLSFALMARYRATFEELLAAIVRKHPDAKARLLALIDRYRDALNGGDSLCLCVAFAASRESLSDDTMQEIATFRDVLAAWVEDTFACGLADGSVPDATDPAAERAALLALLEGAQLIAHTARDPALFDAATALARARFS